MSESEPGMATTTGALDRRWAGGKAKAASPWGLFLGTLPPGARALAWLLWPVRHGVFEEELRVFGRLADGDASEEVPWVRGYLGHPRYRRGSWLRRLGLRGRVSLLDVWARRNREGVGP